MEITKDSSINEILRSFPESASVFDKYNMGCRGCLGATAESVENGALMHGLDVNVVLEELQQVIHRKQGAD